MTEPGGEISLYQTEDGTARIEVRLDEETVWLSLNQLADLFQRDKFTISRHIRNIFAEGELAEGPCVADFATHLPDGRTYQFAQLRAQNRQPTYRADWLRHLDRLIEAMDAVILACPGSVSHAEAGGKAKAEYAEYRKRRRDVPSEVAQTYVDALRPAEQCAKEFGS